LNDFFNCFRLALNNILNKRLRSWLTLLGIVIGVAAVVAIVSISNGAQESMNARFNALGADIITGL
jgi:putative ABC transport system permease protein